MLSNRPDHRSKSRAARLARRWKIATICRDNAREWQRLAAADGFNRAAAHYACKVAAFVNQRGHFYTAKVQALHAARRVLNLWHLEGRGKIRQGAR